MSFLRAVYGILHRKCVRDSTHERVLDVSEIEEVRFLLQCSSLKIQPRFTCFFLSTVVSQALYKFPQRQWNKRSYSIPVSGLLFAFLRDGFSFMDSTNFLVERLWKVQSNSGSVDAASICKRRETWSETQTTLWLLIEHMILLTCEKKSFAIQIEHMDGCLSSSLVG